MSEIDLSGESWGTISRLLDQAFDLPADKRAAWLDALDPRFAPHRPVIEKVLEAHARAEQTGFLERLPSEEMSLDDAPDADPEREELRPGDEVGPYRLERELDRGGMGRVWLAQRTDGALKRPVALKLPRPELWGRSLLERFSRERDILAGLDHPHIARLYDAGATPSGRPYLALEYVEGESITSYCDRHRLDVDRRIELFLQVLDAVQHAHRNLVVHRDLKPNNILVTPRGEVRLLDFGIAKLLAVEGGEAESTELTELGGRALTPGFASPEQISGSAVTTASDVYSLGVILYELLCGQRAYRLKRGSRAELEEAILETAPPPPSRSAITPEAARDRGANPEKLARVLRGDLDTIVLKALKKEPMDRYASADAFARDLDRYLRGEAVEARPEARLYRIGKFVARHRTGVTIAAAVAAALLGSSGFALLKMREATEQRDAALFEARRAEASQQLTSFLVGEASVRPGDTGISERLEKSRELIRRQFSSDPAIRAGLLFEIAERYDELRELSKQDEVMAEIETIARDTDLPSIQARYRCVKAELALNEGNAEAARALVSEGLSELKRERRPQLAATIECMMADSNTAAVAGDYDHAIARAREAVTLHEDLGITNTQSYANALDALTAAHSFAGDTRNALATVRKERDTHVRMGRDDTLSYLRTLVLEASFLNRGGRRQEALARSDELFARSRARGLPDNPIQLHSRGVILIGLGRYREALEAFDVASREFAKQGVRLEGLQVDINATEALVRANELRAAHERLDPVWAAVEEQIAQKNPSMTKGLRVRAQLLLGERRSDEAWAAIERAVALVDASKSRTYTGASAIYRVAAEIAQARGDPTTALSLSDKSVERARRDAIDETASADIGEALLTRARILAASGRAQEAAVDRSTALVHFGATLPSSHPLVQKALDFAANPAP